MNTDVIMRSGKRNILVVEDVPINQQILGYVLNERYNVFFAGNGQEAMDFLHAEDSEPIAMILLDINMPVMDGITFLKLAAKDEKIHKIPIIVLTGDKEAESKALQLGAIDFIMKPYDMPEIILARIGRIIEFVEDRQIIQDIEHDPLTGLYNRNFFFEYGRRIMAEKKDQEFDIIAIDIDRFRLANEMYGKAFGDQVLKSVADGIRKVLKTRFGIGCRVHADLFYVLTEHRNDYRAVLDTIVANVHERKHQSILRVRMGVFERLGTDHSIDWYAEAAGAACDTIRGNYQWDIMIYDEALHEQELNNERFIAEVDTALESGQFRVYYQPKYAIQGKTPRLVGAEALIRWEHPDMGFIRPNDFVPLFEENGMVIRLDNYVWQEAARQIKEWNDKYSCFLPVSVNVSRKDLFDEDLLKRILDIVKKNRISPEELVLEVTESAYSQDTNQMIQAVAQLRDAGFKIEMDDFGTGYSSLSMLCLMPIDALKIDMNFVRNIMVTSTGYRMMELVVEMARTLKLPSIVEGVEDEEQYQLIKKVGCDIVQGFYFSKPVDPDSFEELIRIEMQARKTEL